MKPFDLEAAKRGEPIVTRDGRKARFVAHIPEAPDAHKVIAFIEDGLPETFSSEGIFHIASGKTSLDLFMAPPPMRSIKGYEYPEPVREPLEIGQRYWIPLAEEDDLTYAEGYEWGDSEVDMVWLKRGLIQLTREAAEAHARAIILASGGEV